MSMWAFLKHWAMALLWPRPLVGLLYVPRYIKQYISYRAAEKPDRVRLSDTYPCLTDAVTHTPFDPHYFYQGAWLTRRLAGMDLQCHVDVGSSVLMLSVMSAVVPIVFLDYRPVNVSLSGFAAVAGSITNLPFKNESVESISCLHVLEHIGLGRYGDPLDPSGSYQGAAELQRLVRRGGRIYVSVPIGRERVCFNAHRVLSAATVVDWFGHCRLVEFSFVDDTGQFNEDQSVQHVPDLEYGCGMFVFEKIS